MKKDLFKKEINKKTVFFINITAENIAIQYKLLKYEHQTNSKSHSTLVFFSRKFWSSRRHNRSHPLPSGNSTKILAMYFN